VICIRLARHFGAILVVLVALCACQSFPGPGSAEIQTHNCAGSNVVVQSAVPADAIDACRGAQDAIDFFKTLGLASADPVSIELVSEMPHAVSASAAGSFLESERRALVLNYDRFRAGKDWFGIFVDRRLYQSVVTHEAAHALALNNFRIPMPSIQAKEYIAYVTMFATMSESHRRMALAAFPGAGFSDELKMSSTIYLLDPMRFGAESYRHYLKTENGASYLRAILSGAALVE